MINMEKKYGELFRYSMKRYISQREIACANMAIESYIDHVTNTFVCELQATLVGSRKKEEKVESETISVPETWWDGFKLMWFPIWLSLRYPPKMREIEIKTTNKIEIIRMCPHIPSDGNCPEFVFFKDDPSDWRSRECSPDCASNLDDESDYYYLYDAGQCTCGAKNER